MHILTIDMLPETSSTKATALVWVCSSVKVVSEGGAEAFITTELRKSSDSIITSHVLLWLHILFCIFGASLL